MRKFLLFFSVAFGFLLLGKKADAQTVTYATPDVFTVGVAVNLVPTVSFGTITAAVLNIGALPAGLTLNANGTITGTPTTVTAAANVRVRATIFGNGINSNTFIVSVVAAPVFNYTSPHVYTVGTAITALAPTGTGTPLTGATIAPAGTWATTGLTLNANGTISGTPTGSIGATVFTVTAVGSNGGTGTATITITVNPVPPAITYSTPTVPPYTFYQGITITAAQMPTPTNTGGAIPAGGYSISPALPAGFTFNTNTGVISGTPTATSSGTYTVTATNTAGSSSYGPFTINVVLPAVPNITYSSPAPAYVFLQNVALTVATDPTPTNTGGPLPSALAYSYTGTLPTGLAFSTTTGIISGTPTVVAAATSITVTATNAGGISSATFTITINPKAPVISYPGSPYTFYAGVAGSTAAATNTGGAATFSVDASTPFPSYLSIDPATGIITANNTSVVAAQATYQIDATNVTGNSSANVKITIAGPPILSYTATPYTYVQGSGNGQTISITNTGGAPTSAYAETGTLPTGITFATASGQFTVNANTVATGTYTFTVNASNPVGSSSPAASISITINPKAPVISYPGSPYTFYAGVAGSTAAATNTGGAATFSVDASTPFPSYLSIDPATGIITANNTSVVTAQATYKIDATNVTGSSSANVKITIAGPPSLSYTGSPYTYVQGSGGTTYSITNAAGAGAPTSAYAETGTLPTGITFNTANGRFTIANNPTAGTYSFTVNASNPAGSSTPAASISITVYPPVPTISYAGTPYTFTVGTNVGTITPTTANSPTSFTISAALPGGLTFDPSTGDITGTPTTVTAQTTYTVTASNANPTSGTTTIKITVNDPTPVISYSPSNPYLSGASIDLTVTNSETVYTTGYSYTGALPPGFTFNTTTGEISGTAPAVTSSTTYTATVTASTGSSSGSTSVSITVNPLPPVIAYTPPSNTLTQGTSFSLTPNTSGGGAVAAPGTYGSGTPILTGLTNPYGMAVDPTTGNVYVVNDNGASSSVTEYSGGSVTTYTIGVPSGAIGIVFDSSGNAYVLGQTSIVKFTGGLSGTAATLVSGTGLSTPGGIAIDASNNLYVSNSGNNTITRYTSSGTLSLTITAPTFFGFPTANMSAGIAVDASGNIFVADNDYDGIFDIKGVDEYSNTGSLTGTVTGTVTTEYQKGTTNSGVYIDAAGNIYITDTGAKSMTEYSSGFASTTLSESGFNSPRGVVTDGKGNIYVSDYAAGTVTEFSPTGGYTISASLPRGLSFNTTTGIISGTPQVTFASTPYTITAYNVSGSSSKTITLSCNANPPVISYSPASVYQVGVSMSLPLAAPPSGGPIIAAGFTTPGTAVTGATLSNPWGMTTDGSGDIWVANYGNATVIEYSAAGAVLHTFTVKTNPTGIAVDAAGNFYISTASGDIYKYNAAGAIQNASTVTTINNYKNIGNFFAGGNAEGIAIDASGNLYVTDNTDGIIWQIASGSTTATQFVTKGTGGLSQPTGIAVDASGNVYVVDLTAKQLLEYSPTGTFEGVVASSLTTPYGLYIDSNGDYYIGDSGTGTVSEYDVAGNFICQITLPGTGPSPRGLAMDGSGDVYVADYANNTITKYSPYDYTISSGSLPPGLSFSKTTGTISGTPTTAGSYPITVSVYGADGNASSIFTIVCANAPAFYYSPASVYPVGVSLSIPVTVTAGGPIITTIASVSPALPTGLSIDGSGNISGIPAAASTGTYTVTATNSYGLTGTATVTINCQIAPAFYYSPLAVYQVGQSLSIPVTVTAGGPIITTIASVSPALPAGLSIDGSGNISGTPAAASTGTYTVTATNAAGLTGTAMVTITCANGPAFSYSPLAVYPVGVSLSIPVTVTAGGPIITTIGSVSPALPTGLSIDGSGNISGTPAVASTGTYTVTATNSYGFTGTATVTINCQIAPAFYYSPLAVYQVGQSLSIPVTVTAGGPIITTIASVSPALPTGLSIDGSGNISGTPAAPSTGTYTVTATNAAGLTGTAMVTITCANGPAFSYSPLAVYPVGVSLSIPVTVTAGGPIITTIASVSPALPGGLSIDGSGNISGTPAVASTGTYTVTATNSYGFTGTATVTINCQIAPVFNYSPLAAYQVGQPLSIPVTVTAGGPIITTIASVSPALPTGLSIDGSGNISGTPAAPSTGTYTVTATNAAGLTGTAMLTINCVSGPVFTYSPPSQVDTVGMASPSMSPSVTAGSPISYAIAPGLPGGLTIDAVTGIISSTPTPTATSPLTTYTVTATDSYGFIGTAPVTITVVNPRAPAITYLTPQIYVTNVGPITPLTPTNTGGIVVTYSAPSLPAGLTIDPVTGIISGTPTTITAATDFPVTATNAGGSSTFNINITVNPPPPVISYNTPNVYNINLLISPLTPASTGGPVLSWSVSPALPAGLSIDPSSGIISGTPTALTADFGYVVTATNAGGSATFTVGISVVSDAPVITYATPDIYTVGTPIAPLVPTNTGSAVASWSISPALPAGLTFDNTTGIITGTPTATSTANNYTVTATNAGGNSTFVVNIACVNPGPVLSYTTPDIFPVNIAITPLVPVNTGSAPTGYSISPGLPTGLNFSITTGIISGTPTVTSPATPYTVTASDGTNTGTTTISIACTAGYVDWIGIKPGGDWNDPANWATGMVPTATDIAGIGVNQTFLNLPNVGLTSPTTNSVAAIVIGSSSNQATAGTSAGAQPGGIVINSGGILNVTGAITYQSDGNAGQYTAAISGAGTVSAAGINVTANTTLGTPATYTETMATSVSSLSLSSNVALTSNVDGSGNALNATFNITGGTVSLAGALQTNNAAGTTSTLAVVPATTATLQLAGPVALSGLSATPTSINMVSFNNAGATIEYSGAGQTYYTNAGINGLSSGVTYSSIKFSGSGLKSPNGTNANNLTITGDFTNALTTNDASDYIDLSTPLVTFSGTTQNVYGGNGTGTKFYNVTFNGTGTTTIQSGSVAVASTGVLTMGGSSATLVAGGLLTLNSDVNGTATVAAIPTGCRINGTVNAQRFITGGAFNYRGYRLVSSPVYGGNDGTSNIYSINYLINTVYLKGSGGTAGGWDAAGNPNVYLFRENLAGTNQTFSSGNFRSLATIGTPPNFSYMVDNDGGPYNIPVGDGFMFFFRGDRNLASLTTETSTTYIPTNATLTASGTLNQGQVTVSDWYTPTSTNLGYTTISGDPKIEGFNLVGNPYASSIDWDDFDASNATAGIYGPNVNAFLYIMDPVNNNYNIYLAKSGLPGTQGIANSNVIPSGQGFFVTAANASAQLIFSESAKTNAQANAANGNLLMAHRLPSAIKASLPTSMPQYLHLKMAKDSVNNDGMIISFRSNTSRNFNAAEDAPYRLGNGSVVISSMSADNVPLGINSMPLPATTGQTIIPLNVWGTVDGTYTINLDKVNAIPALFTIWLKDAYKKDSLDIRDNPTYTFDVLNSDTNSYGKHRFTLVMGENSALMIHLLSFGASKIQGGDQVIWTTENEQNYTNFTVERSTDADTTFNDLGGFLSTGQGSYSYLDKTPVNGANMYRLKIVDINGTVTYSNVVTIMYANTNGQIAINGLMVYPNPTAATINLSIPTNQGTTTKPNYNIEIVNNLGSVIKSAQSSSPLWQSDVSSLTPGTYFIRVIDTSSNTVVGKSAFVKL